MREIKRLHISTFISLAGVVLALDILASYISHALLPPSEFRGIAVVGIAVLGLYAHAILVYRIFLHVMPLTTGEIVEGSREELVLQVNSLFYLVFFNSLVRTHFLPIPMMRVIYQALGSKFGRNTFSAGAILDPPLVELGDNCIIGHDAVLFCHVVEGNTLALAPIVVGNDVTIGAMAVVMPGVKIGDRAIVSAGSVVTKGSRIGSGELWGGVPARRIR